MIRRALATALAALALLLLLPVVAESDGLRIGAYSQQGNSEHAYAGGSINVSHRSSGNPPVHGAPESTSTAGGTVKAWVAETAPPPRPAPKPAFPLSLARRRASAMRTPTDPAPFGTRPKEATNAPTCQPAMELALRSSPPKPANQHSRR